MYLNSFSFPFSDSDPEEPEIVEEASPPKRMRSNSSSSDGLEDFLVKTIPEPQTVKPVSHLDVDDIKEEMASFERNGQRPPSLEKVYNALLSVPPTSCEAERWDMERNLNFQNSKAI